jgi:H+/Cl- antiporter ClcA
MALGFFVVKFGGFALATGLLVASVPAFLGQAHDAGTREIWHGLRAVAGGVAIAVAVLFISHGISFVMNYLVRREYENTNLLVLTFWPYVRMSLVVMALAAGLVLAALIPALDTSATFGVAVVLVKTAADLVMHQIEHAWLAHKTTAA